MDIVSLATGISNMKTASSIGISVLKKAMDTGEEQANNLIQNMKEMELSVNPNVGSKFDMRI